METHKQRTNQQYHQTPNNLLSQVCHPWTNIHGESGEIRGEIETLTEAKSNGEIPGKQGTKVKIAKNRIALVLYNLDQSVTSTTLWDFYERFLPKHCSICYRKKRNLGWALIEFTSLEQLELAKKETEEKEFFSCRIGNLEDFERYKKRKAISFSPSNAKILEMQSQLKLRQFLDTIKTDIRNHVFYSIDFECSCIEFGGIPYPCEVAICEFSLQAGEIQRFHHIIDPGEISEDLRITAEWTMENVHGIDKSWYNPTDKEYSVIWDKIVNFVKSDILFAKGPYLENVCLNWLSKKSGKENTMFVYDVGHLIKLFHQISNTQEIDQKISYQGTFNESINAIQLTNLVKCDYHQYLNSVYHCALSDARKVVYALRFCAIKYSILDANVKVIAEEKMEYGFEGWACNDWGVLKDSYLENYVDLES